MLLDIAHLIDSAGVERYQNKYSSASVLMKDCQMQLSGPWPPYHFVHRLTHYTPSSGVVGNVARPAAHLAASA
jgi:hypothetical protein